jgi:hypothetical protein
MITFGLATVSNILVTIVLGSIAGVTEFIGHVIDGEYSILLELLKNFLGGGGD